MPQNIAIGKRRRIRDIVLARLTADGTPLKRFVRTWQLHQGKKDETLEWTAAMLPAVRVSWDTGAYSWNAENQHAGSMGMHITLGLAGTDQGDLMDFWEAVEGILFPCSQGNAHALLVQLQSTTPDLGVTSCAIEQAAISDKAFGPGDVGMIATGVIRIRHKFNT